MKEYSSALDLHGEVAKFTKDARFLSSSVYERDRLVKREPIVVSCEEGRNNQTACKSQPSFSVCRPFRFYRSYKRVVGHPSIPLLVAVANDIKSE